MPRILLESGWKRYGQIIHAIFTVTPVSLLAKFWTCGEGALNQHLFKVTSDRYPAWFFSEWVQHHFEEVQIIAASKATTMATSSGVT
jgi:hypothetical protein